jgi:hypothetical protein
MNRNIVKGIKATKFLRDWMIPSVLKALDSTFVIVFGGASQRHIRQIRIMVDI